MAIDINSEPGAVGADKTINSTNQAGSATEISKTSNESVKIVKDKFEKIRTGLDGLDIGFLTAECPSQSDIENYVTRGHIDFPLTFPKNGNNQTFPEYILKFRNINGNILDGCSIDLGRCKATTIKGIPNIPCTSHFP